MFGADSKSRQARATIARARLLYDSDHHLTIFYEYACARSFTTSCPTHMDQDLGGSLSVDFLFTKASAWYASRGHVIARDLKASIVLLLMTEGRH